MSLVDHRSPYPHTIHLPVHYMWEHLTLHVVTTYGISPCNLLFPHGTLKVKLSYEIN